ncbi:deoxyribodipyrimidine photo-lyase [Apibacter raozihei]|uniref:cryptochrome/photolyase family protein n=1 Tax=Apibacter raozihei TaxID=2500547 RepID=UPI000FE3ECCE|nr:deoxyribodipyrimidine photo-lyase [Apibacter raozihei]
METVNIFWFRRDLRLEDNLGLYEALKKGKTLPIFIFDSKILDQLPDKYDARVTFIYKQLTVLNKKLEKCNTSIALLSGSPIDCFKKLCDSYSIESVYCNEDYEPYGLERDKEIEEFLKSKKISFKKFQDHVICNPNEVFKKDGSPYTIYTPYSKQWKSTVSEKKIETYSSESLLKNCINHNTQQLNIDKLGFKLSSINPPELNLSSSIITNYKKNRDYPSMSATTHLGIYLRFGTVSIREIFLKFKKVDTSLIDELIWREFFISILYHFPKVVKQSFKSKYDNIKWRYNEDDFDRWKEGKTGYPIVDAGMRELNESGTMHNRVRMITASFLCKHLLIDWRWGEAYFASKLLDFELASNNGNWQWASGSGCDSVPYFRVFNPTIQMEKFDKDYQYIKKWIPEFSDKDSYLQPMVEHSFARDRALKAYKDAL